MAGQVDDGYLEGPLGWARSATVTADHPNSALTVAQWLMHLPNQGLGWDKYMLGVVSLEDVPGRPPPVKHYPEAEYELLVAALDPDRRPRHDDVETWMPMQPVNFVGQFHGVSRDAAARIARSCTAGCVSGQLLAETQVYVELAGGAPAKMMVVKHLYDAWVAALAKCVEHEKTGGLHERIN